MSNYSELQQTIDTVIGKIGLERTQYLLASFIANTSIPASEGQMIQMLCHFAVSEAVKAFELEEPHFFSSLIVDYRDARMACIHLLRKYTASSYPKIGLFFKCSTKAVTYATGTVQDRLDFAKANASFVTKYSRMESHIIDFIAKLNQD